MPREPEQNEERRLNLYDSVASQRLAVGYHVTSADQEDSYALDVLASILFDGTTSRAHRRLVEEKEWMHSVSGVAFTPTYPGLMMITGVMRSGVQASSAEGELDRLIREVQETEVTADEISKAVRQLTMQLVDSVRTPQGLAQLIGTVTLIFGSPDRFGRDLAKYFRVTPADVKRVANQYLVPNNRTVVVMFPEQERVK